MAKKYYAVRKGNQTGLFYSWDACKSVIDGYSGAEYRGFQTEEEALEYLRGNETAINKSTGQRIVVNKPTSADEVNIYTDGSFKDGKVSFGVFIETMEKRWSFYGVVDCPQYASLNNIAGELIATMVGVQVSIDMGFTKLNIFYDQTGVASWYDGSWTARGQLQVIYSSLLNQLRLNHNLKINFNKVKAHNGIEGNVRADKLAERARNFNHYVDLNAILRGTLTAKDVPLFR